MWRAFIRDQQGSVSAVAITMLLAALILLMVIVDREWVNYTLKVVEQTADFAAEAGARNHEVYTIFEVSRIHFVRVDLDPVCITDPDGITQCDYPWRWDLIPDTVTLPRTRERDLVTAYKQMAECGDPYWEGSNREYRCTSVQVVAREVEFPAATDQIAEDTFRLNWNDHASAVITHLDVVPVADVPGADPATKRSVFVGAYVEIHSLFGLLSWHSQQQVIGRAVVTLNPLNIRP